MSEHHVEPSPRRAAGWILPWWTALALPPLALRGLRLAETGVAIGGDVRGVASDLAVTLLLAVATSPLLRQRVAAALVAAVWTVLTVGNDEHLRVLGAQARLDHAAYLFDPTFVVGSALPVLSSPRLWLLAPITVLLAVVACRRRAYASTSAPLPLAIAAVVAVVLLVSWPADPDRASWRQAHVVEENVRGWLQPAPAELGLEPGEAPASDLDGEPRVELGRAKNVLLVILEGVSGGHLPSLAAAQGREDLPAVLPRLDAFARRHLAYTAFVAQQRQTNRGEYALLCGEAPRLPSGSPKMSELARAGDASPLPCLPQALRGLGYRTVYLQAAPLAFMLKDRFMPRAGFDEVHGDEWFRDPYLRNQWGVDDRTFFEQSLKMIDALRQDARQDGRPWFLTLLTVGTHHPFNAPSDFDSEHLPDTFPWAADYLDRAVGPFLERLEANGLLDDTLVVVTSDESVGLGSGSGDEVEPAMAQAWGMLLLALPSGETGRVDEPFVQADLPLTVLDLLGPDILERSGAGRIFSGRSAARRYASPRSLAWGNVYLRRLGGLSPSGLLYVCLEDMSRCSKWRLPPGRLFSPERQRLLEGSPTEVAFLARAAAASLRLPAPPAHTFELVAERRVPLVAVSDRQWIFAGQFLWAPAGSRLDMDLSVVARGEPGDNGAEATVWLVHDLLTDVEVLYRQGAELRSGQRVVFRYAQGAGEGLERIESRLWVLRFQGRDVSLEVERAQLTLTPAESLDVPAPAGRLEESFAITRADG